MQNDSHSCGIFAMKFAEELLKSDPKWTRINVNSQRRNIILSIVAGVTIDADCYDLCQKSCRKFGSKCQVCKGAFHTDCLPEVICQLCQALGSGIPEVKKGVICLWD